MNPDPERVPGATRVCSDRYSGQVLSEFGGTVPAFGPSMDGGPGVVDGGKWVGAAVESESVSHYARP